MRDVVGERLRRTFRAGFRHRIDELNTLRALFTVYRVFFSKRSPVRHYRNERRSWLPEPVRCSDTTRQLVDAERHSLAAVDRNTEVALENGQLQLFVVRSGSQFYQTEKRLQ